MPTFLGPTLAEAKAAIPELERRHALCPSHTEIYHTLGVNLFQSGRAEEALPIFEKCVELEPDESAHYLNLANCLKDLGQMDRQLELNKTAYDLNRKNWITQLAYAESLLRLGRYREAWPIYSKGRWTYLQTQLTVGINETVPKWRGEKLDGPLVVHGEGGWGDRINHSRFLPEINRRGVEYVCLIDSCSTDNKTVLGDLFNRCDWIDRSQLPQEGEPARAVNAVAWTTTFELLTALDITPDDIPEPARWYADPERAKAMEFIRSTDERPTVGLVWRAGEVFEQDRKTRSMSEWDASRLVLATQHLVHWVNLQHEFHAVNMTNPPPFRSWDDTAAAIENCDLVISVDTGPMHLAKAMRKPTWLILPGNSDWKFGLEGPSPWYRDMRIFRNSGARGFEKALGEVAMALHSGAAAEFVR